MKRHPHPSDFTKVKTALALRIARSCLWTILTIALHANAAEVSGDLPLPATGPAAGWVVPLPFERLPKTIKLEPSEDQRCLLLERQINAAESESFTHTARQILTATGVQKGANLTIDFHPSYQSLIFHWVRIWRGTSQLNRLEQDRIKVIQPERDLDEYLFSGRKSAVLVLEDVRVGDIIDAAYSIRGANPILDGKFSDSVIVQLQQPVERLATRLLWPAGRRLYVKNHECTVKSVVKAVEGGVEYTWDFRKVPALHVEDLLPDWYDPEPWVQLGEFQSWTEVNQWALNLFRDTSPASPELTKKIAEWRRIAGKEQQIAAVLRFVQEEVRYFGIEIGASSHQPSGASQVFARRFGDCKDKVQLFVTILRVLGIEAFPVLVNTSSRQTIEQWQPSTLAFDHVIALVRYDKQTCWLDATANNQRGPLVARYLPAYGRGLVVHSKTTGLTAIPPSGALSETTVHEYFQLGRKAEPAGLKVVTWAKGTDAEGLRELFATTPRAEIEKSYLHYYSRSYPGIRKARPLLFTDDEQQNRIEVTEFYTVDRIWVQSDKDRKFRCEFFPVAIAGLQQKPVDVDRTMPLGLRFPRHVFLRTEVVLPEPWPFDTKNKVINDPAFSFRMFMNCRGNKLEMEYEYNALADSVLPNRIAGYLRQLSVVSETLGYSLSWQ